MWQISIFLPSEGWQAISTPVSKEVALRGLRYYSGLAIREGFDG